MAHRRIIGSISNGLLIATWIILAGIYFDAYLETIRPEDLAGRWEFYGRFSHPFNSLYFKGDSVYIEGNYGFRQRGTFHQSRRKLTIRSDDGHFATFPIYRREDDEIWLTDSSQMAKYPGERHHDPTVFPLLALSSPESSYATRMYQSMHYYQDENGKSTLRLGSKISALEEIPLYVRQLRSDAEPDVLVFLDSHLNVPALDTLHRHLALNHISWLHVALDINQFGDYEIFRYHLPVWEETLDDFRKGLKTAMPPPPPEPYLLREDYLANGHLEVKLESLADIEKIYGLKNDQGYLVAFSAQLPLQDYFLLKTELYRSTQKRKIRFRTELFYPEKE